MQAWRCSWRRRSMNAMKRQVLQVAALTLLAVVVHCDFCPPVSPSWCNTPSVTCTGLAPYQCMRSYGAPGCNAVPWTPTSCNGTCVNVAACDPGSCSVPCNSSSEGCGCAASTPYYCSSGEYMGVCWPNASILAHSTGCQSCCNSTACHVCPPCTPEQCASTQCLPPATQACLEKQGGCGDVYPNRACLRCCSIASCPTPPPPPPTPKPTPKPASPWDLVPGPSLCNSTGPPAFSPSPSATPYGAADVSNYGCREHVHEDCCGYYPRFNWILSTCERDVAKRSTMACKHSGASHSRMEINYVAAYQWNGSAWKLDPTSSAWHGADSPVNLTDFFVGGGWPQDWDLKYAPTSSNRGTNGLGPPGMLFVLSAKQFAWSAFYVLNQITVNRGPGGEKFPDNCWSSSSGEFDLIESPFWADVIIPENRLYLTTTADSGRCLPAAKNIPPAFAKTCNSAPCCQQCACGNASGKICYGNPSDIGYQAMGCQHEDHPEPLGPNQTVFTVDGSNTTCGNHFGAVAGGGDSSAYFVQPNLDGDVPMMYAAVIDRDGVSMYRWPADRDDVWPGLDPWTPDATLTTTRPDIMTFKTPCNDSSEPCGIYEPSCHGDCPVIEAGNVFGLDQSGGPYAAEAAKQGMNWWHLFNSTGQIAGRVSKTGIPYSSPVPHFTPKLPFNCTGSCGVNCSREQCSPAVPYMCTWGDGIHGCAKYPDQWPLSGRCLQCCNVSSCYFECTTCSGSDYDRFCVKTHPCKSGDFICTSGNATKGCATQADFWGHTPSTCSSCCRCPRGSARARSTADTAESVSTLPLVIACVVCLAVLCLVVALRPSTASKYQVLSQSQ